MVATGWPVLVSLSQQGLRRRDPRPARGRAAHRDARRHRRLRAAGARIYRVHEVVETRQTVDMVWTIAGPPAAAAGDPGAAVTPGWCWCRARSRCCRSTPGSRTRSPTSGPRALDAVGWLGADVTVLADAQGARVAEHLLASTARAGDAPSYLVVGNGSARRTEKAPGHLDERAEAFDADLGRCLEHGLARPASTSTWRASSGPSVDAIVELAGVCPTSSSRRSTTTTTRSAFSTGCCAGAPAPGAASRRRPRAEQRGPAATGWAAHRHPEDAPRGEHAEDGADRRHSRSPYARRAAAQAQAHDEVAVGAAAEPPRHREVDLRHEHRP